MTIRKVVELTFADEGIDVSTVADSDAAMQRFVEMQPDIVLVDVGLNDTSGYRFCEMIKQDASTRHIPVLLLVGSFEPFDQTEAERVEADGFLTKPFHSIRDLVARVRDLLGREPEPEPIDAAAESPITIPETDDIDNLYNSSFERTAEFEEFDTVDDLLGDSGMDDEMIEASYPTDDFADTLDALLGSDEKVVQTKEFDWSPESMITEPEPVRIAKPVFEPKFVFEETDEDEVTINEASSNETSSIDLTETDEIEPRSLDELIQPVDAVDARAISENGELKEPSPELVALIARRVVEMLSDSVIREIAQTAVPQIAEKLIREALEEENKA